MASKKKIEANRRNSESSTGPIDTGKTRLNALSHGIFSEEVLILTGDGKEDPETFKQFKNALCEDLAPLGALEELLVDELTMLAWRMRRVLKFETALISKQSATVKEDWRLQQPLALALRQRLPEEKFPWIPRQYTSPIVLHAMMAAAAWAPVSGLLDDENDSRMTDPAVQVTVRDISREFGVPVDDIIGPEPNWESGKTYSKEQIEKVVEKARAIKNYSYHEFWREVGKHALKEWESTRAQLSEIVLKEEQEADLAGLPDDNTLAKIQRYEAHLSRQFFKALHELQRIQAARLGFRLPVPLAVDFAVDTPQPDIRG